MVFVQYVFSHIHVGSLAIAVTLSIFERYMLIVDKQDDFHTTIRYLDQLELLNAMHIAWEVAIRGYKHVTRKLL